MKYKLVGGPSAGTEIEWGEKCIPIQRYLYLNGNLYWKTHLQDDGYWLLLWEEDDASDIEVAETKEPLALFTRTKGRKHDGGR